jgi:cytochrome c oxidase subunit III
VSDRPAGRGLGPAPAAAETGALGMAVFIISLSMLFAASVFIYLLMRHMHQPWPPAGFPALPRSLWLSTLDILATSFGVHMAVLAARRDDQAGLRRSLVTTLALGVGFLGLQAFAWQSIWRQVVVLDDPSRSYLTMFYAMTGLHALHVVGGLVPLVLVTIHAYQDLYGPRKNAAVRYTAMYWHFLDAVWCVLFVVVYLL